MALQNTDYFLVNRAGTAYRLAWSELQSTTEGSLQIQDVFTYTGSTGATTRVDSEVPINIDQGIRLPVAGVGDYNVDGAIRYSPGNSKIELYYAGAWNTASGGTAFSATPPVPATEGDVWYDTDNGRAYVYYNDGTSSQWVELNPAWDGGAPPNYVTTEMIQDGAITPIKLSPDAIKWNTQGYHAIGQEPDNTSRLTVRSLNSGVAQDSLNLIQGDSSNSKQQVFTVEQNGQSGNTTLEAQNTGVSGQLVLRVQGSNKLTIPASGNITSSVNMTIPRVIGDLTGDVTGSATQIVRNSISSSSNENYRVLLGESSNTAGASNAYVVTNATRLYYNPATNTLTSGTFVGSLTGTATNANKLDNLDSTAFFRLASPNIASGSTTFNANSTFNSGAFFASSTRHNDSVILGFGNTNDAEFFFNGSNMYTDLNTGNYYIRDNTTTRFTFTRTTGAFTATGTITAPTFSGNLSGNATSSTTAGTATNANNIQVDTSTSTNLSLLLGSDTGTGYKRSRRSTNLYWAGSTNTLHTTNLSLTGTASGGTYQNLTLQGTVKEQVHTITWSSSFSINPSNGSFQLVTLSGNSTPTQSAWDAGESVTLMIADGSNYTVNWGTLGVVWTNAETPDLPTSGYLVIQLWKIGNTIYGAPVGEVA